MRKVFLWMNIIGACGFIIMTVWALGFNPKACFQAISAFAAMYFIMGVVIIVIGSLLAIFRFCTDEAARYEVENNKRFHFYQGLLIAAVLFHLLARYYDRVNNEKLMAMFTFGAILLVFSALKASERYDEFKMERLKKQKKE